MKKYIFIVMILLGLGLIISGCGKIMDVSVPKMDSECVNCLSRNNSVPDGTICIDFENPELSPGDSVEGLGTLHPLLDIDLSDSETNLVLIQEGDSLNKAYDATTTSSNDTPNGCLNGDYGMGCVGLKPVVNDTIVFSFADGVTVDYFSFTMLDYGDWTHSGSQAKSISISCSDSGGWGSATLISFPSGNPKNYDACHSSGYGIITYVSNSPGTLKVKIEFHNGVDRGVGFDDICFHVESTEVSLDIKPTSCPNPVNLKSKGVLPIAILGTEDFDVAEIDPETVLLEGVAPLRWALEDVATPYEPYTGKEDCMDCNEFGPDGYNDLTFKFDKEEIIAALGEVEDGDCIVLAIQGELFDGIAIYGEDVIKVLKKGK